MVIQSHKKLKASICSFCTSNLFHFYIHGTINRHFTLKSVKFLCLFEILLKFLILSKLQKNCCQVLLSISQNFTAVIVLLISGKSFSHHTRVSASIFFLKLKNKCWINNFKNRNRKKFHTQKSETKKILKMRQRQKISQEAIKWKREN